MRNRAPYNTFESMKWVEIFQAEIFRMGILTPILLDTPAEFARTGFIL